MEGKICSRCRALQPHAAFYRNRRWKDGFHPWCTSCLLATSKERYEARCRESRPHHRWHRDAIHHEYFSDIDTPRKAYLLGFLAADGNVHERLSRISLELSEKDTALAAMVRDELAPKHQLHRRERSGRGYVTLAFTSARMAADLARQGVVPHKSRTLQWPVALSHQLEREFILGYFDGDGAIMYGRRAAGHVYPYWNIVSGSEAFLLHVVRAIARHTSVVVPGPWRKGATNTFSIRAAGNNARVIDAWLHETGLGLARKRLVL